MALCLLSACALSNPDSPDGDLDSGNADGACGSGRDRLRGVCVDTCGADLAELDPEFASDLRPIAHVCATELLAKPFAARDEGKPGSLTLVDATAAAGGTPVELKLRFRTLTLADGKLDVGTTCTLQHATQTAGQVALHDELGLSPSGQYAHVLVRELDSELTYQSLARRAYVVSRSCAVTPHDLGPGSNETTIMLADDPTRLIVTGYMPGLGTGIFLGSQYIAQGNKPLRRYGDDGVLTMSGSGHGAVWLAWLSARALADGPYPVSGLRSEGEQWPYEFVVARGRGLVGDRPVAVGERGEHWLFDVQHEDGRLYRQGTTTRFASQRFSRVLPVEASERVVLEHARGLLVVE
ncbi:MAG TPA: hypothetical protein VJV78_07510 [Polyangiales bacterium]|nr:hypothetical protein [Polyangiales bacterium]